MPASSEDPTTDIRKGLAACYEARVRRRFGTMRLTPELEQNLERVAKFLYHWFGQRNHRHRGLMLIGATATARPPCWGR